MNQRQSSMALGVAIDRGYGNGRPREADGESSTPSPLDSGFESARTAAAWCDRARLHLFGTRCSTAPARPNGWIGNCRIYDPGDEPPILRSCDHCNIGTLGFATLLGSRHVRSEIVVTTQALAFGTIFEENMPSRCYSASRLKKFK